MCNLTENLKKNQKKKNSQNPKIKIKNKKFAKVKFLKSVSNFMMKFEQKILPKNPS